MKLQQQQPEIELRVNDYQTIDVLQIAVPRKAESLMKLGNEKTRNKKCQLKLLLFVQKRTTLSA